MEGILIFCIFYTKVQIISIPLFIVGGLGYLIEIIEMKKANKYDIWQLSRGGCLLFFEFLLIL